MNKFLEKINKLGINFKNHKISNYVENENPTITIDMDVYADKRRILNFTKLFIDTTHKYGIVLGNADVLFDDGSTIGIRGLFTHFHKKDKRIHLPKKGDLVKVQNCFSNECFLTVDSSTKADNLSTTHGLVVDVDDGIYSVNLGGKLFKLPSYALRALKGYTTRDVKSVFSFLSKYGHKLNLLEEYNYISITSCSNFVEYIPKDRLDRFDGKYWCKDKREKFAVKKKIRGAICQMFESAPAELVEEALDLISSDFSPEIVSGKGILDLFSISKNAKTGNLAKSCMLGKPEEYFEIYEENAEAMILKDKNGLIIARAIIWKLKSLNGNKNIKLLDRIYTSNDSLLPKIKSWAKKKNFVMLQMQRHSTQYGVTSSLEEVFLGDYYVKIKRNDYEYLPYLDTFCYMVGNFLFTINSVKLAHSLGGNYGTI